MSADRSAALQAAQDLVDALMPVSVPMAAMKCTQADAEYRPSTEAHKCCADCTNFNASVKTCDKVAGRVEPQSVCNLFNPGITYRRMTVPRG